MTTTDPTLTDRAHIRIGMCSCIPPLCPNCKTFADLLEENAELRAELHCAWERRVQIFNGGRYSHDAVSGVGCRSCDLEHRHCQTVENLRQALLGVSS